MSALAYLIRKRLKNTIKSLFTNPAKLISYAAIIFLIVMSGLKGSSKESADYLDLTILHLICFGAFLFISLTTIFSAIDEGTTVFEMADVNMLFISPISSKHILIYGLLQQTAGNLMMMLFLMCYAPMISNKFKIGVGGTLALLIGLVGVIFLSQITGLVFYSITSHKPKLKRIIKGIFITLIFGFLLYPASKILLPGGSLQAGMKAAASPVMQYFPIVGWVKGAVFCAIENNWTVFAWYFIPCVILGVIFIFMFLYKDMDYYEDVLDSTETMSEAKKALREKNGNGIQVKKSKSKSKIRHDGLKKGWGANAFFYKQVCQNCNTTRIPFVGISTGVLAAVMAGVTMFIENQRLKEGGDGAEWVLPIVLLISVYVMYFMNLAGDWPKELKNQAIYLVPESAFKKLFWASLSSVIKPAVNGTAIFLISGIVAKANPLIILICIITYASCGLLFTAVNIFSQKILGQMANEGLIGFLYFILLIVLLAPGIVSGIFIMSKLEIEAVIVAVIALLPAIAWNILASLGIVYLSRNLLDKAEMK